MCERIAYAPGFVHSFNRSLIHLIQIRWKGNLISPRHQTRASNALNMLSIFSFCLFFSPKSKRWAGIFSWSPAANCRQGSVLPFPFSPSRLVQFAVPLLTAHWHMLNDVAPPRPFWAIQVSDIGHGLILELVTGFGHNSAIRRVRSALFRSVHVSRLVRARIGLSALSVLLLLFFPQYGNFGAQAINLNMTHYLHFHPQKRLPHAHWGNKHHNKFSIWVHQVISYSWKWWSRIGT